MQNKPKQGSHHMVTAILRDPMTSATWAREHFDVINGHIVTPTGQAEISAQAFGKVLAEEQTPC